MRNPVHVLKNPEDQATKAGYRYERIYRNLYNPDFYLLAYQNIARSQGSMTSGVDGMTLDNMTEARIQRIINRLKDHSYQPKPARRVEIPKKSNPAKKRPLGIQSTDDKLVEEVTRMILEAIFEPTFSQYAHGFRPNRSCHSALKQLQVTFTGMNWVIEGDIKACFDSFDHHVLIDLIKRRIHDEYFIALMWKFLKAGYMEQWLYHETYSGTPQGSGISPLLTNVYLSELDDFVGTLKAQYDTSPGKRERNPEYVKAQYNVWKTKKALRSATFRPAAIKALKTARRTLLSLPSYRLADPNFKRIQYNRYADDFVIGVIGSKQDAEGIKAQVSTFLRDRLKLTLSEEKTMIMHSDEKVRYLGYDFTVSRDQRTVRLKDGGMQRTLHGKVMLYMPHEKWVQKLKEYKALRIHVTADGTETWKAAHRGELMPRPDHLIIGKYNAEIRGLYNYYCLATNASTLAKFYFIMKGSLCKTLAAKYNTSCSRIRAKYTHNGIFGAEYMTSGGIRQCEFYHDGFRQKDELPGLHADVLPQYRKYDKPNTLAGRLKAGVCEVCGCQTKDIHMHHVKQLKDLTGKNVFECTMIMKRRKSLALCPSCFEQTRQA